MGLFSLFRKNKQETVAGQGEFRSRAEGGNFSRGDSRDDKREKADVREEKRARPAKASKERVAREEPADPMLPEKKRARRRLIGALALVLAVIIVLPMILDSEPKPVANDIAIQIPSKDLPAGKGAPSQAAALDARESLVDPEIKPGAPDASTASAPTLATPAATGVAAASATAGIAAPAPVESAATDKKPTPAKPVSEERKPDVKPEAKPKPEVKPDPKPAAAKPSGADADAARAMAILEGKPAPAAKPATGSKVDGKAEGRSGKFVIQVAALATQEKIDELRGKLTGAGISSFTQKVATAGGDRTRIRVGPFGSKEEAERMRARIVKLGLNGTLVPA